MNMQPIIDFCETNKVEIRHYYFARIDATHVIELICKANGAEIKVERRSKDYFLAFQSAYDALRRMIETGAPEMLRALPTPEATPEPEPDMPF